jgi:hypothetical protein
MALASDPFYVPLAYLLDEEPIGEVMSVVAQTVDSGDVVASVLPDNSWREAYLFHGVSNIDHYLDNKVQNLLRAYYSGAEMRVYRDVNTTIDAYDYSTNPLGYSDMVAVDAVDADFEWYDNVLTRFSFSIEGVQIS